MPPVTSAVDPRIIALAAAAYLYLARRAETDREDGDEIPRAWHSWGYEPVATLISAWRGRHLDPSDLRTRWRQDINSGPSGRLPVPDAIIKRGPKGELLPGWSHKTIREWLTGSGIPCNMDTYLPWADVTDEVDPRLIELIAGNEIQGEPFNHHPADTLLPPAYLTLGYEAAAALMTQAQGKSVKNTTVRHYWRTDLTRVHPTTGERIPASGRMPIPDAVIGRGSIIDLLPGWTPETIVAWLPARQGPGNHTYGADRRGYNSGRTGLKRSGYDENGKAVWIRVAEMV